jgi:hypothetical protein
MKNKSLVQQEFALRSMFPGSFISRYREDKLTWVHCLTPSEICRTYKVKLQYTRSDGVSFYVLEPKLQLAEGHVSLPHVYDSALQKLCLFEPGGWNSAMYFVHTIIPWACEWLYHYEVWVATGRWNGGGKHPKLDSEKQDLTIEKEN